MPLLLSALPNLSDEVNSNIVQSKIEVGVNLQNLRPGFALQVHTQHTCYDVLVLFASVALISGHPLYCPRPVLVTIRGSTWGGSMLKVRFIGLGMRMEFHDPGYRAPMVTSPIQEIRECTPSSISRSAVPLSTGMESRDSLSPLRVISAGGE